MTTTNTSTEQLFNYTKFYYGPATEHTTRQEPRLSTAQSTTTAPNRTWGRNDVGSSNIHVKNEDCKQHTRRTFQTYSREQPLNTNKTLSVMGTLPPNIGCCPYAQRGACRGVSRRRRRWKWSQLARCVCDFDKMGKKAWGEPFATICTTWRVPRGNQACYCSLCRCLRAPKTKKTKKKKKGGPQGPTTNITPSRVSLFSCS